MHQSKIFITTALRILEPFFKNEAEYIEDSFIARRRIVSQIQKDQNEREKNHLFGFSLGKVLYQDLLLQVANLSGEQEILTVDRLHLFLTQDFKDAGTQTSDSLKQNFKNIFFDRVPDKNELSYQLYLASYEKQIEDIKDDKTFASCFYDVLRLRPALNKLFKVTLSPLQEEVKNEETLSESITEEDYTKFNIYNYPSTLKNFNIDHSIEIEVLKHVAVLKKYIHSLTEHLDDVSDRTSRYTQELIKFLELAAKEGMSRFDPEFKEFSQIKEHTQSTLISEVIEWQLMLLKFSARFDEFKPQLGDYFKVAALETLLFLDQGFLFTENLSGEIYNQVKKGKSKYLSTQEVNKADKDQMKLIANLEACLPDELTISERSIRMLDRIRIDPEIKLVRDFDSVREEVSQSIVSAAESEVKSVTHPSKIISQAGPLSFLIKSASKVPVQKPPTFQEQEQKLINEISALQNELNKVAERTMSQAEHVAFMKGVLRQTSRINSLVTHEELALQKEKRVVEEGANHEDKLRQLTNQEQNLHLQIQAKKYELEQLRKTRQETIAVLN